MTDDYSNKINEKASEDYLDEHERHIWDRRKSPPIPLVLLGFHRADVKATHSGMAR